MVASFLGNVGFSYLAKYLFESGKISHKYDFLDAVVSKHSGEIMDKTTLVTRGNNIGLSEMASVKPRLSVTLAAAFTRRDTLPAETVEEEEEESSPDSSRHDEEWLTRNEKKETCDWTARELVTSVSHSKVKRQQANILPLDYKGANPACADWIIEQPNFWIYVDM